MSQIRAVLSPLPVASRVPSGLNAIVNTVPVWGSCSCWVPVTAPSTTAYRHYWELTVLLALRDGLRSGDVFVPGSRRYADPVAYLIPPEKWESQREEFCRLVGKPADPAAALDVAERELDAALGDLERVLAGGDGPVWLDDDGQLVIAPLTAEDIPTEAAALKAKLAELLPFAAIITRPRGSAGGSRPARRSGSGT